jgi:hypothetical protein
MTKTKKTKTATKTTREDLLKAVYKMDKTLKKAVNEEARDAMLLLLGAWVDGPLRANKTAQIPEARRRRFMKNLRNNRVFVGNTIHAEWEGEDGGYALLLDANVALGFMSRVQSEGE